MDFLKNVQSVENDLNNTISAVAEYVDAYLTKGDSTRAGEIRVGDL